jgi:hypothetical protein
MSKEAMKLALEALKNIDDAMPFPVGKSAIKALEEALAKQKQCKYPNCDYPCMNLPDCQEQGEPVAFDVWLQECESMTMAVRHGVQFLLMPEESAVRIGTAIQNTTPQQRTWVGLTDEEIAKIGFESADRESAVIQTIDKLKEKNNG